MNNSNRVRFEVTSNLDSSKFYLVGLRESRKNARYLWHLEKLWIISEHPIYHQAELARIRAEQVRKDMQWS